METGDHLIDVVPDPARLFLLGIDLVPPLSAIHLAPLRSDHALSPALLLSVLLNNHNNEEECGIDDDPSDGGPEPAGDAPDAAAVEAAVYPAERADGECDRVWREGDCEPVCAVCRRTDEVVVALLGMILDRKGSPGLTRESVRD